MPQGMPQGYAWSAAAGSMQYEGEQVGYQEVPAKVRPGRSVRLIVYFFPIP